MRVWKRERQDTHTYHLLWPLYTKPVHDHYISSCTNVSFPLTEFAEANLPAFPYLPMSWCLLFLVSCCFGGCQEGRSQPVEESLPATWGDKQETKQHRVNFNLLLSSGNKGWDLQRDAICKTLQVTCSKVNFPQGSPAVHPSSFTILPVDIVQLCIPSPIFLYFV